jgi:hypothetical protein
MHLLILKKIIKILELLEKYPLYFIANNQLSLNIKIALILGRPCSASYCGWVMDCCAYTAGRCRCRIKEKRCYLAEGMAALLDVCFC